MNQYASVALTASIITILIGLFVTIVGQKRSLSKSFGALSFSIFCWQIGCFGESFFLNDIELALIFDKILYSGAALAPVIYLNTVHIANGTKRKYMPILYIFSFIFLIFNWLMPLRATFFISNIDNFLGYRYIAIPMPLI